MPRRGSSPEQLAENREKGSVRASNFLENFLNLYKGASARDFLPGAGKASYDISIGSIPFSADVKDIFSIFGEKDKNIVTGKKNGDDKTDPSKPPSFEDVMGIGFKDYLSEVARIGEEAKNRDMLRSGISSLAYSPLIGSQAAMESAANISKLTGVNMAAIANQGDVMAQNPTKQKIAGRYFR